ncbi:flagellar export chaperone FliS [Aquibacillus kalidii]|uniref:flagellar export chaperone FliS n=1 Tax=Aquibacillus kalidii TaxID=2762597 RepID=UPI00164636A6|nr:flagellar export chaperone FliS [Aquibacillus kalidii]
MMNQTYNTYQNNSVMTASPADLTLMLYNGCLKFIKQAKKGIEENNYEKKNTNIQKSQNIIDELSITLDQEVAISKQVLPLYDFIKRQLVEANIKNDVEKLDQAAELITEFRDTWQQVIKINRQRQYSGQGSV